MKILKHILTWTAGALCYIALAFAVTTYDNADMHPAINSSIVDQFMNNIAGALNPPAGLAGYLYVLDGNRTYTGPAITNAGYFASGTTETDVSKTPKGWIAHGGYSADIPEVPAALRHFFDPLGIDGGKTYLTDRGTNWEWIVNNNAFNPRINARDWALTHADNQWSFAKGKQWMVKALAAADDATRSAHMARAWRCLGETLHLIADMGCPVHVRNDSHADVAGWSYRRALGDPDPYEVMVTPAMATKYGGGTADPSLKSTCRSAETATEIFNTLATFTNAGFFTNQTISGTGVKKIDPIIKGRPPYPSPKLEHLSYDPADFTFYKTFPGGQRVKMCKDHSFWSFRGYPYIDLECVESQASALMPNVMEAGVNVMRLFIPRLKVEIGEAKIDGTVTGSVTHVSTREYTSTAVCRGTIRIFVDNEVVGEGMLEDDGTFELSGVRLEEDDEVEAEYRIGGISVRSAPVTAGDASLLEQLQACRTVLVEFAATNSYTDGKERDESHDFGFSYMVTGIGLQPVSWNGRSFTFSLDHENSTMHTQFTITGTVSKDGRTLESVEVQFRNVQDHGNHTERAELRLSTLPFDPNHNIVPTGDFAFGGDYPEAEQYLEFFSCHVDRLDSQNNRIIYDSIETLWKLDDRIHVKFFK